MRGLTWFIYESKSARRLLRTWFLCWLGICYYEMTREAHVILQQKNSHSLTSPQTWISRRLSASSSIETYLTRNGSPRHQLLSGVCAWCLRSFCCRVIAMSMLPPNPWRVMFEQLSYSPPDVTALSTELPPWQQSLFQHRVPRLDRQLWQLPGFMNDSNQPCNLAAHQAQRGCPLWTTTPMSICLVWELYKLIIVWGLTMIHAQGKQGAWNTINRCACWVMFKSSEPMYPSWRMSQCIRLEEWASQCIAKLPF